MKDPNPNPQLEEDIGNPVVVSIPLVSDTLHLVSDSQIIGHVYVLKYVDENKILLPSLVS